MTSHKKLHNTDCSNWGGMNCSVCNVSLKSPSEIASHFTGKKHLKAVANVDLRLKQEGRAVYVTKLGKLSLTDIASFFATFGEVRLEDLTYL